VGVHLQERAVSELTELKKQNKQLKKLLKNAVELLNRYKDILEHAGNNPPVPKLPVKAAKAVPKRAKSKKTPSK
jgi:type I site-specific restriction-modification system R (restriction) subunit